MCPEYSSVYDLLPPGGFILAFILVVVIVLLEFIFVFSFALLSINETPVKVRSVRVDDQDGKCVEEGDECERVNAEIFQRLDLKI